jgi:hypothetical protein
MFAGGSISCGQSLRSILRQKTTGRLWDIAQSALA